MWPSSVTVDGLTDFVHLQERTQNRYIFTSSGDVWRPSTRNVYGLFADGVDELPDCLPDIGVKCGDLWIVVGALEEYGDTACDYNKCRKYAWCSAAIMGHKMASPFPVLWIYMYGPYLHLEIIRLKEGSKEKTRLREDDFETLYSRKISLMDKDDVAVLRRVIRTYCQWLASQPLNVDSPMTPPWKSKITNKVYLRAYGVADGERVCLLVRFLVVWGCVDVRE